MRTDIFEIKLPVEKFFNQECLSDTPPAVDYDQLCSPFKKRVHDPAASYDAYDESDDTPERAKAGLLKGVGR